jgi:anaerobic dimethyl sulfoxide reductase subunit B (iron-sulfur subunit)
MACKDYKDLGEDILFRKVYDFEGGVWSANDDGGWDTTTFSYHVSAACNHCAAPACQSVCPTEAILRDEETGLVYIDEEACISCEACVAGCPYSVPKMDPITNMARKCDGCLERVKAGQKAICAEACPLRALELDEIEKLRKEHGELDQIAPLPANATGPHLVIKASPAVEVAAGEKGFVANEKEIA